MMNHLRPALTVFAAFTLICGVAYPLAVTGVVRVLFPKQSGGSIIELAARPVGSSLIGQDFSADPKLLWGRPSATGPAPYTSFKAETLTGSSGSNLALTNPALMDNVRARIAALDAADAAIGVPKRDGRTIPVDLVTASGSGLDPHITPAAAEYQVPRIAKARGLSEETVRAIIHKHTSGRTLGALGEPAVNVLEVNLDLASGGTAGGTALQSGDGGGAALQSGDRGGAALQSGDGGGAALQSGVRAPFQGEEHPYRERPLQN